MKALLALCLTSLLSLTAFAHGGGGMATSPHAGDRTADICADSAKTICAHLNFLADVNSSDEGSFLTQIQTPGDQAINNLKIELFMDMGHGHGHGSAPLEIAEAGSNQYKVTNAWFVMMGPWLVRIDFDFNGVHQHIEIPVYVAQ